MNSIRFTRIASGIWSAITSFLVLALVLGFIMVMSAQYMERETEFSLSLINGLSYRSKPTAKPNPALPANSASSKRGVTAWKADLLLNQLAKVTHPRS